MARHITITQGNVNNRHFYLTEVLDLFPKDVFGGENRSQAAEKTVRVIWDNESVETDIVADKNIFRRRDWVLRFFAAHGVVEGDSLLIEQLDLYTYRVSKVESQGRG